MRKKTPFKSFLEVRGREFRSCRTPAVPPWIKAEKEAGLPHQQCVKRKSQVIPHTAPQPGNWTMDAKTRPELQAETIMCHLIQLFIRQAHQRRKLLPREERTKLALPNRKHLKSQENSPLKNCPTH